MFCLLICLAIFTRFSSANRPPLKFAIRAAQPERLFPEEGTRLTLECPLHTDDTSVQVETGKSKNDKKIPSQFRWYRDGLPLDRHTPLLAIPSVARLDAGLYRCYAFNQYGGAFGPAVNVSVECGKYILASSCHFLCFQTLTDLKTSWRHSFSANSLLDENFG